MTVNDISVNSFKKHGTPFVQYVEKQISIDLPNFSASFSTVGRVGQSLSGSIRELRC